MTYRHKREKCAQETKEILEKVLKIEKEEYGCLDCAESVRVSNPMEKILAEEMPREEIKSQTDALMEEVTGKSEALTENNLEKLDTYVASDDISSVEVQSSIKDLKKKKKGSYVEFRKDYRR